MGWLFGEPLKAANAQGRAFGKAREHKRIVKNSGGKK